MNTTPRPAQSGATENILQTIELPTDHPAFAGHFPGRPIVPGVVLLDQVLIAIAGSVSADATAGDWEIASAKFLSPLLPGEALQLHAERTENDGFESFRFTLAASARPVASGVIKHRRPAEP